MDQLLVDHRDIVVFGTVSNQSCFYDRFEHVVLLSAPVEILLERVGRRTNNPHGRARTAGRDRTSPGLRRADASSRAKLELDGRRQPGDLADIIEKLGALVP